MKNDTLAGRVVAPWDPSYHTDRIEYNGRFNAIYPSYINYCHTTKDVERAIRWARHNRVPFRVRSGGHSYEAYSLIDRGLVIDVSAINHIDYNAATGLARIGSGAQLLDIYQTLWSANKVTIPGGSCATVGIGGLTLGGGLGLISRKFGLTIDVLQSLTMVDARGKTVKASQHLHPDLFWALRGAGGNNFGVITEFTFRTVPVDNVAIFFIQWPWEEIPSVVPAFQSWASPQTLDARLTPILTLPSKQNGHISVVGQFLGPLSELEGMLKPLLALARRTGYSVHTLPYIEATRHFAGLAEEPAKWQIHGVPHHDIFKNTSAYAFENFPPAAITVLQEALSHTPGPSCLVQLGGLGGAIAHVKPQTTAFFHRSAHAEIQYQAYWTDPAVEKSHIQWVEHFRLAMRPYTSGAYVNYCDSRIKNWPEEYWGGNLARLLKVKQRWDPANIFRFPQGLSELVKGCHHLG